MVFPQGNNTSRSFMNARIAKPLLYLLNLMQESDLSRRRKEACFNRICCQLAQMLFGKAKRLMCQPIFVLEIAQEHRRIVRIESNHQTGVEIAAHRMLLQARTAPCSQI